MPIYKNNTEYTRVFKNGVEYHFAEKNGVRLFTRANAPVISAYDILPEYLLDSAQAPNNNLVVSGTVSGATNSGTLTEVLTDGTQRVISSAIAGNAAFTINAGAAPNDNAEYVLSVVNSAGDRNSARKTFYRVISPRISISATAPVRRVGAPSVTQRLTSHVTITRTGKPLPSLSLSSSAGTTITHDLTSRRYAGLTTINIDIERNEGASNVADTITLTGVTNVDAAGFTPITVTDNVVLNWPGRSG